MMSLRLCLICGKEPIGYACEPCGCAILCKRCAMRMATGGKCKQCGKFFIQCSRYEGPAPVDSSDDEGEAGGAGAQSDSSADA